MPMSTPTRRADRSGFTLMEILVVLVIMAVTTAVIMPSMSRMLDQATSHAVFFEFQRQIAEFRREANRTGVPIRVVDPSAAALLLEDDRTVTLRAPWRYTLAPALQIAAGGVCAPTTANLVNVDRVVMTLRLDGANCQFIRQQTTVAQLRESSARR